MSKEIIDAFLADPRNAELRAEWEALYPDPRDEVFIRHRAYRVATGFDNLVVILEQELVTTHEVMSRSPELRERGKPTTKNIVNTDAFPRLENETGEEWQTRLNAEAERQGVHWTELMVESTEVEAKYWELQGVRHLVYAGEHDICQFLYPDRSKIFTVSHDGMSPEELESIIQGLRLLRTQFNGAVV
jgi:hypothetical protein